VFLWEQTGYLGAPMLFGAPVWLQVGQISAMLPKPPAQGAYVRWFVRGFPSQPVFVITPGGARPSGYDGLEFAQVDHVVDQLPIWKESNVERPSYPRPRRLKVDFSVWRVVGT
jgi:hypothetical protein